MRLRHLARVGALAAACALSVPAIGQDEAAAPQAPVPFDRQPWLEDYAALKASMAQGYANLDWAVAHRGIDLLALDAQTTAQLAAATSQAEALDALKAFIEAFHDPHLQGQGGPAPADALRNAAGLAPVDYDAEAEAADPASPTCAELGYQDRPHPGRFNLDGLVQWRGVASPYFEAGRSGDVAFLRIGSFSEHDYLAACEASWQAGRSERATQLATRAVLQQELSRLAALFAAEGAKVLTVDVTENGGGSEWSEEAATLFTARELTRPKPEVVAPRCDRSPIWRGEKVCANLPAEREVESLPGQGAWQGPLAILADLNTASAAEDFAYWLAGSKVAVLVGERTLGAGCGYMDGGWAYQLKAIAGHVMMPNCARYTFEGVNQVEGLEPQLPFDWSAVFAQLPATLATLAH